MKAVISWLEATLAAIPLPLLEVWGRLSFIVGLSLAVYAFGGFTFRIGRGWGFARERQAWDARGFIGMPLTFAAILASGYLGSFIVLVPGAQTLESLKDLVVFLCIVLFGYPALVTVPFAYGLSDLVEGVPPEFLLSWLPGYFINPACFWLAYQMFGKDPDFKKRGTWVRYAGFVLAFASLEPILWGFVTSAEFTPEISYRSITPALFFTTTITWLLAPPAMLAALPAARRLGLFWAEIPGHVSERALFQRDRVWESGGKNRDSTGEPSGQGLPLRMFILFPFSALVLVMVAATAYEALKAAEEDSTKLASRLHEEVSENIQLRLATRDMDELSALLAGLPIAADGRAFLVERSGRVLASSSTLADPVVADAVRRLDLERLREATELHFAHITVKPLSSETWFARAVPYREHVLVTALPEAFYLAGVRSGNSRSAMVFSLALLLSLIVAALLASVVTAPLRRMAQASRALAAGDRVEDVPSSRLEELGALTHSFNDMARRLKASESRLEELVVQRTLALEKSEKRTKGILENLADGVITIDGSGRIQGFSSAASRIFGYDPDELLGENVSRLMPEPGSADHDSHIERYLRTREARAIGRVRELLGRRKDGSIFPMELAIAEVSLANEHLFTGVIRDISERKRADEALRIAKEQADAASRAKTTFLANISHEIRTPMNAVLGFGQLMERDSDLTERDRTRLHKILANGYHLLELINNVLEMSKIEAGRIGLNPSNFDLHALLTELDGMVRGSIEEKGLRFELEGLESLPRYVRSDAGKLRQILINLLGNARKFTERGGISLAASVVRDDPLGCHLRFQIRDSGVGIAPDEVAAVFEPFEQTKSGRAQTGTGLGVSISRDFARLLGGDLTVASRTDAGSTFTLEICVERCSAADVDAPGLWTGSVIGLEPGQRRALVLVVDDEEDNRQLLRELLGAAGLEVADAPDGARSVELFAELQPDLVFMDVKMPVMDGVVATEKIRSSEHGASVPIVLLSASVFDDQRASVLRTGATEFIAKPFREEAIWGALERHLGLRFQRRARGPEPETRPAELTREEVAKLGAETLVKLRESITLGYVQRIPALLEGTPPAQAAIARELSKLARDLEIDRLLRLL